MISARTARSMSHWSPGSQSAIRRMVTVHGRPIVVGATSSVEDWMRISDSTCSRTPSAAMARWAASSVRSSRSRTEPPAVMGTGTSMTARDHCEE